MKSYLVIYESLVSLTVVKSRRTFAGVRRREDARGSR